MNHAPGSRGFDVNYLNPIAMLRPIEFSVNSPDNVLVGLTLRYNILPKSYIYGQLILDEFSIKTRRPASIAGDNLQQLDATNYEFPHGLPREFLKKVHK